MSLRELFEEYLSVKEEGSEKEKAEKKLIEQVIQSLENLKDPQFPSDQKIEKMKDLKNLFEHLPDIYFEKNADKILGMCVNICDKNVYKIYDESDIDLTKPEKEIHFPEKLNANIIGFKTLAKLLRIASPQTLLKNLKPILQQEHKNSQLYLFLCDIVLAVIQRIDNKENYINELLVDLLRCLNPALSKYIKYKTKVDNKEVKAMPSKINDFLNNFEKWGSRLVRRILHVLEKLINQGTNESSLLLVEDLVESGLYKSTTVKKDIPSSKLMAHYCVIFSLDLLEGLLDSRAHNYFSSDNIEQLIQEIYQNLLKIHPYPQDYITNYNNQVKYRNYNSEVSKQNERDINHLPKERYGVLTIYNSAGVSYVIQRVFENPNYVLPLSVPFRLKLIMPALHILLNEIKEKEDLKLSLTSKIFQIAITSKPTKHIDNLNYFDVPLTLFMHSVLKYSEELGGEQQKGMGIKIFKGLTGLFTDNAQVELISDVIRKTTHYAVSAYLINEYRAGIQATLKDIPDGDITRLTTTYLQVRHINRILTVSIKDVNVAETPDQTELLSCGLNLLVYLSIKFVNTHKGKKEESMIVEKSQNAFCLEHKRFWLKHLAEIEKVKKKVDSEIVKAKTTIDEYTEEEKQKMQNKTIFLRYNQLLLLNDTLEKLNELREQIKAL